MTMRFKKKNSKGKFRVLDTFAGAGGFSLGFQLAGAQLVGAIESDNWATETFKFNHPEVEVIKEDITKLSDGEILKYFEHLKPTVLLGGPPCQGFSVCNKNNGDPKDPRNSLFEEFIRVGRLLKPEIMVMENVPNLIKAKTVDKELVIDIIISELENLGFYVQYKVLEATDYGVPQIRKRLVIIATREKIDDVFPKKTHTVNCNNDFFDKQLIPCPTLWEAISDLPDIEAGGGAEEMPYIFSATNSYQSALREKSELIHNHKAMNHSKRLVERFASMQWGNSTINVPEHLKPLKRNTTEVSDKIYGQNNRRMHPDKPCHTVPASFYANFVHPYKNRNFTAREGARIQSFPDWYVFKGKPTIVSHKLLNREGRHNETHLCQYNQIGNAVPPLMAKAIAQHLINRLGE